MITYSIKEGSENAKDIKIVKTGHDLEFTIGDIDADVAYLEKTKKEIEGKIGIEKATMENVKRTHPHVAEMTPVDLTAAYLFRQAQGYVSIATEKIDEINKQLSDYKIEKEEILRQTGIVLSDNEIVEEKK